MNRIAATSLFCLSVCLGSCDSSNLDALENRLLVASNGISALEVSTLESVIEVGESRALTLTGSVSDADGETVVTDSASWSSSDEAFVTVNQSGIVTGVGDGSATITATLGPLSSDIVIRASSAELQLITIAGDTAVSTDTSSINECASAQFTATGTFEGEADSRDITDRVSWMLSAGSVGLFDLLVDGLLRSNINGESTIAATLNGIESTFDITVLDNLAQITVDDDGTVLTVNNSVEYTATASYIDDPVVLDISDNANWTLDTTFASVDNALPDRGLVSAISTGSGATLEVSCGGVTAEVPISSGNPTVIIGLEFDPNTPFETTFAGPQSTIQLNVFTRFESGAVELVNEDAEWIVESNDNPLNDVSNSDGSRGLVTIGGAGELVIEVSFVDENNDPPLTFTSTFELTVNP